MSDAFDPDHERAALALDAQIDAVLAGRWTADDDTVVHRLAATIRTDPPPALGARVAGELRRTAHRRLAPVRVAAAAMAYLFISHGVGNLVNPEWIARNVGEPNSVHFATEGGLALVAVGLVVALAALRPVWLPAAVTAGVPLGLAFGVLGVREIGEFNGGAVLHLSQLAVALYLGIALWRHRRYARALRDEGGA